MMVFGTATACCGDVPTRSWLATSFVMMTSGRDAEPRPPFVIVSGGGEGLLAPPALAEMLMAATAVDAGIYGVRNGSSPGGESISAMLSRASGSRLSGLT